MLISEQGLSGALLSSGHFPHNPKTRVGPGIQTSDLPITSSLLCDHKTEHPHCCERVDPCVHTFSITASPALRACGGLLEPIQVVLERRAGLHARYPHQFIAGPCRKTTRMRASELPICYVPWKSFSQRNTTTLQNATQETQEVKFVGGETQEINCEWDKGVAISLKWHQGSFCSQLILLDICEAVDGQRLFQPWKSRKPLH